ncbi:poly(A)-specific ribonuclease PARN-like isoform X1 [Phoenix dactylifera]|uniref:Poly(A)-specific ribonuclease PARN-like isoform X1 n=1 Tax=Phoenix dactylifera TaxID=42345 RepID=A0A8B7CH41_PHODC|nr:poly(A)-specific ribonuclease PARN-like isoform X1 [Phoenix dactylifera]
MVASSGKHRWGGAVKQITKSNFSAALQQIKVHIQDADFIAVSSQKTGDLAASSSHRYPWRRILPIDIAETAYLKAKLAAETFELLQFAVCPFRFQGSKVVAFPYNFHLFPRDELNLGMPSYSFSCQTSFLASMAREGFDFNVSIYDGISYLSRAQESIAKERTTPRVYSSSSSPSPSVADSIFIGRIKSRVENWRNACKDPCNMADGSLAKSLRKLILGGEVYGSRPSLSIDVCSDRQVQLALEMVTHISDDLVPLVVPDKSGGAKSVRVVLTSSEEDKNLLMSEIQNLEEEQNLKVRGFREVIDLISSSKKPIIAYNCLHDFTFIHSKFISPLQPSLNEFMCSLRLVFSNIVDVSHLLKEIGPLRKARNLPAALSYLKRQFFVPIDVEIPQLADGNSNNNHGHNVLKLTRVFAKLGILLKIVPDCQTSLGQHTVPIEEYANIFYPISNSLQESEADDVDFHMDNVRKISTDDLVFIWGFREGTSAAELKNHLRQTHSVFSEDIELQLVDKTCAVVVFQKSGSAEALLKEIGSGMTNSTAPSKIISEGLKAAGYEAYKKVCRLGMWEAELADSLDCALSEPSGDLTISSGEDASEIYWSSESMIDLNDL